MPLSDNYEEQVGRILKYADRWETAMDLGWITINYKFLDHFHPEEPAILAENNTDWEYRQSTISWYIPRVTSVDDRYLEASVVHELVHSLTAPIEGSLRVKDAKLGEFAVESLARAFLHVRETTT